MIVCSLHQPSFEILDMIDNIIVLDNGYTVYNVSLADQGISRSDNSKTNKVEAFQISRGL